MPASARHISRLCSGTENDTQLCGLEQASVDVNIAQTGSIKIQVPEGYTGDYSTEVLEDTQEPKLTGGYLLFLTPKWDEPLENVFITDRLVRFGIDSPEFTEGETGQPEQKAYITDYIQKTENAIFTDLLI